MRGGRSVGTRDGGGDGDGWTQRHGVATSDAMQSRCVRETRSRRPTRPPGAACMRRPTCFSSADISPQKRTEEKHKNSRVSPIAARICGSESPVSRSPPPRASCPGADRSHVEGGRVCAERRKLAHSERGGENGEEERAEEQGASGEEEEGQGGEICIARSRRERHRGQEEERKRARRSSQGTNGAPTSRGARARRERHQAHEGREKHDPPKKTAFASASASASAFLATPSDIGNYAQSRIGNMNPRKSGGGGGVHSNSGGGARGDAAAVGRVALELYVEHDFGGLLVGRNGGRWFQSRWRLLGQSGQAGSVNGMIEGEGRRGGKDGLVRVSEWARVMDGSERWWDADNRAATAYWKAGEKGRRDTCSAGCSGNLGGNAHPNGDAQGQKQRLRLPRRSQPQQDLD
ncbi:hypothetical protein C8R44DRAFT_747774 [Mycena epipterygia]|nr:hypothetical protein C8R44DRAFT_747774 [Mycena epipterygia]